MAAGTPTGEIAEIAISEVEHEAAARARAVRERVAEGDGALDGHGLTGCGLRRQRARVVDDG